METNEVCIYLDVYRNTQKGLETNKSPENRPSYIKGKVISQPSTLHDFSSILKPKISFLSFSLTKPMTDPWEEWRCHVVTHSPTKFSHAYTSCSMNKMVQVLPRLDRMQGEIEEAALRKITPRWPACRHGSPAGDGTTCHIGQLQASHAPTLRYPEWFG